MAIVVVLATGGTIAGTTTDSPALALRYEPARLAIEAVAADIPDLPGPIEFERLAAIDSKDMDDATWQQLAFRVAEHAMRPEVSGIVVTHGTDTMEETAYFLHRVIGPRKPVILTGAMRPHGALLSDGPQNLLDAVRLARAGGHGVMVLMLGRIYAPDAVAKASGFELDAFEAALAGPIGIFQDGELHRFRAWPECEPLGVQVLKGDSGCWPHVVVFSSHAGVRPEALRAWVDRGVDGIVMACPGNGSLHRSLEPVVALARSRGIPVWRVSRCARPGIVGVAQDSAPPLLTPEQARIELMLMLRARHAGADFLSRRTR